MKEFSNIFPSPPKLCSSCENKQEDFLRFRSENEDTMSREELNSKLVENFKCCNQCTENTKKYFEKQEQNPLAPLVPVLTVKIFCFKVKKSLLLKLLTLLLTTLRTIFDTLFVFFQTLFCLHSSSIIEIPDEISVFNFQIPFNLLTKNFYATLLNIYMVLIFLEIISYCFYFCWSTGSLFNLRSSLYFVVGWAIKAAMGHIIYDKLQHEFVISFNSQTYLAIALSIIDIYLTRTQLSANRVQSERSISRTTGRNDMKSIYTQSLYQESKVTKQRSEEESSDADSDEEESVMSMDVESNHENSGSQRDDSSLSEITLDNLKIKQDFGPKTLESFTRNNKNFVFPHQQHNGFKSPQANHNPSFRQSPGNIFQSPTPQLQPQPQQQNSPNIFQQGSPSVTNTAYLRNLFENQQSQQYSPTIPHGQNSKRQPNHFWS